MAGFEDITANEQRSRGRMDRWTDGLEGRDRATAGRGERGRKMQFYTSCAVPCSVLKPGEKREAPQYRELFVQFGFSAGGRCDSSPNPADLSIISVQVCKRNSCQGMRLKFRFSNSPFVVHFKNTIE